MEEAVADCEPRPDSAIVVARAHTTSKGFRMPEFPHWSDRPDRERPWRPAIDSS